MLRILLAMPHFYKSDPASEHGFGIPALDVDGTRKLGAGALYAPADEIKYEPTRIRLIPYFAFANRGESDMRVWMNIK